MFLLVRILIYDEIQFTAWFIIVTTIIRGFKRSITMDEEVNNLVFGIYDQKNQYRRFAHFAWELGVLGYQPIKSKSISEFTLTEQLNLVKLVLSFQCGNN